jgi:hypothetical protein
VNLNLLKLICDEDGAGAASGGLGFAGTVSSVGSFGEPPSTRISESSLAVVVMSCSIDVLGRLVLVSTLNVIGFGTSGNHKFGIALNQ